MEKVQNELDAAAEASFSIKSLERPKPGDEGKRVGWQKSGYLREVSRVGTIKAFDEIGRVVVEWDDGDDSPPVRPSNLYILTTD